RPDRSTRPPRADRPADTAVAPTNVGAVAASENDAESVASEEVIGRIPGPADQTVAASSSEGAPVRKRKRRRRRGERKERGSAGAPGIAAGNDTDESDH